MALLESVSGFRDLFTDPPEFDILHVSRRQQLTNFVRITLGGLALILLAIQAAESTISCFPHRNQTKISNLVFIHETCIDDIKGRDDDTANPFLVLDEYFGWILALQIICLMVVTKVIARNEKSKQICRRFTELSEKILNAENEENEDKKDDNRLKINQGHLVNKYNVFMKQLRENSHLSKTQLKSSAICIFLTSICFGIDVYVLHWRNINHVETMMCKVSTNDGSDTLVDCLFPLFETTLYIGAIFSSLLVLEIFIQISLFVKFVHPKIHYGYYGPGKIQELYELIRKVAEKRKLFDATALNCDLFLLFNCLRYRYDDQSALLVLAVVDKNVRKIWTSIRITGGDQENDAKLSLLTFDKDYSELIKELDKQMQNIKVCCKSHNEVKFNLPIIEILDIIDSGRQMMGIQADDLDEMEISWNRHIVYHKSLVGTENLEPFIKIDKNTYDYDSHKDRNHGDISSSGQNTPPPEGEDDVAFSERDMGREKISLFSCCVTTRKPRRDSILDMEMSNNSLLDGFLKTIPEQPTAQGLERSASSHSLPSQSIQEQAPLPAITRGLSVPNPTTTTEEDG